MGRNRDVSWDVIGTYADPRTPCGTWPKRVSRSLEES
jgi:hypothetical protein